jgi:hypothetical protein
LNKWLKNNNAVHSGTLNNNSETLQNACKPSVLH